MTLEQFAKKSGVTLIECDPSWGGRIGYRTADHPGCAFCGFRSPNGAYRHWAKETFGARTSKVLFRLLAKTEKVAA